MTPALLHPISRWLDIFRLDPQIIIGQLAGHGGKNHGSHAGDTGGEGARPASRLGDGLEQQAGGGGVRQGADAGAVGVLPRMWQETRV
jgi:hypothetical protein